jgi:hypothetical protein
MPEAKKTSKKKTSTAPKQITDADLVKGLAAVQRRSLSSDDFKHVTAVINLLSKS